LLYENREELDKAMANYINEGLGIGQLCVYATIQYRDKGHLEKFSKLIADYKENVDKGNLLVIDLAPLYISALLGDLRPFEEAKKLFIEKAKDRLNKHVRFYGDGTGFLFKNNQFDECIMVEEWWQQKQFQGSYVCSFPKQLLDTFPREMYSKRAVINMHDIVVDASAANISFISLVQENEMDTKKDNNSDNIQSNINQEQIQQELLPTVTIAPLIKQHLHSTAKTETESDGGGIN
jgi:DcmR-like sensory protein